jgi:carbonic anhydrase
MKTVEITYRYGQTGARIRPRPSDTEAARLRLLDGNRAFAALLDGHPDESGITRHIIEVDPADLGLLADRQGVPKQHPFAAVLGCADARVPVELIFNEGPNDLFVVRVAGNGLGTDSLGSLRYAIEHLRGSLRLVVVLGHSGCGAMSAAVDAFLEPAGYLPLLANHALRGILDRQIIVVRATARRLESVFGGNVMRSSRYREALIEASIVINAALVAHAVQNELGGIDPHDVRAVYGVYLLDSRKVWIPDGNPGATAGLAEPPGSSASFVELGDAVASSDRIASLISSK